MNADILKQELQNIESQIINKFDPKEIFLFGSVTKGIFKEDSDIDLCIIKNTDNKRNLIADIYIRVDAEVPFDIVLYTIDEWESCKNDKSSFA